MTASKNLQANNNSFCHLPIAVPFRFVIFNTSLTLVGPEIEIGMETTPTSSFTVRLVVVKEMLITTEQDNITLLMCVTGWTYS